MIARESLEKSCPRFASAAPFLCLMDDHLLCPDTARLLDHRQERLVHAEIVRELRMEGREQEAPVAHEHGLAVELAEHLDAVPERADARRPDEDASERDLVAGQVDVRLETPHLSAERIPVDDQVGETEVFPVDHDHPGTGSEDGAAVRADRLVEAVELREPYDRRRLPARDDEAVEPVQLLREPDLDHV